MPMTEKQLVDRDSRRDLGAELLQAARDLRSGRWARKTHFEPQADGTVRRRTVQPDGTIEKDEIIGGLRGELLAARLRSGMSQADLAGALGVSKRTLENWEQGRVEPTGPARALLRLVSRYPDTVQRLAAI